MNFINSFKNDESGAVTVDWVVLTAAIVGIGMAVIVAISSGVENASNGIYSGLETAANFTITFGDNQTGKTGFEYWTESGGGTDNPDFVTMVASIEADAPDNYTYSGFVETDTDQVIYQSTDGSNTLSIGGEIVAADSYSEKTFSLDENGTIGDQGLVFAN